MPDPLTTLYRTRLVAARTRTLLGLAAAWQRLFDPDAALGSLALLGAETGRWTLAGQQFAAEETVRYLAARYAAHNGLAVTDVDPFTIPDGLIGGSAAGRPLITITATAPAVYLARLDAGWSTQLAESAAQSWLNRVAASEPLRVANTALTVAADGDPRYTGRYHRIVSDRACRFCRLIADRGYTAAKAGFHAHANCGCTAEPEPAYQRATPRRRRRR